MVLGRSGTARVTDAFNQFLDLNGRFSSHFGYCEGYRKVDHSTNRADGHRGDAQYPVFRRVCQVVGVRDEEPAFVDEDIHQGEDQTGQHTEGCAHVVHTLGEDPIISAGNREAAAMPNASATTWAAKPGGLAPSQVATTMATAMEIRAAISSPFSLMFGLSRPLIRS